MPTPSMFCSQMKHSMYLFLSTLRISWEKVEFFMSPSRATTLVLEEASLARAEP